MKKGGKTGTGVGKKKAGVSGKKAGLKQGEKPLLSVAESLAIQSAVLPPETPQSEESKVPIQPLQIDASPYHEPSAELAESCTPPKATEAAVSEEKLQVEEEERKAEESLPPQATGSESSFHFESEETPLAEPQTEKTDLELLEESPVQPQEAVHDTPVEASSEGSQQEGSVRATEEIQESCAVTEETQVVTHAETPLGGSDANVTFGEKACFDTAAEEEIEPEQPEIAPTEPLTLPTPIPVQTVSESKAPQVNSSAQTPSEPLLIITPPAESPPRAASPVLTLRSKGHSKQPSHEFAPLQAVSRMATETYESLDDFTSKVDPPMKKFPTFQPDSSDMMSFDEFLTTIDESPKTTKSLRSSINVAARKEEEIKPKFVQFQPSKMAVKRISVKPVDPEIDKMKQLAKEKEAKRAVRVQAATTIQARIRGFLARKRYSVLRKRYEKVKVRERLAQLREAIRVTWAPYRIYKALKVRTTQMWQERQKTKRAGVFLLFQQHCALSIQKVFRGFSVRKVHRPVLNRRLRGRTRLVAVLIGWKTRKILKFRKVKNIVFQLKEMMALIRDKSKGANASDLFSMINQQVPVIKGKLKAEFDRLYRSGKWAEPWRIGTKESPQAPGKQEELAETTQPTEPAITSNPPRNRDEVPVTSLKGDYSSIGASAAPAKVHTVGFFKRTEMKQPRASEANEKEEGRERSPHSERAEEQPGDMEEERQEDDRPPQPFLKRRSQAVVAQKLKWKGQHRIDCWGGQAKTFPKPAVPKPSKKPHSKPVKQLPKKSPTLPARPQPFDLGGIVLSPLRNSGKQGEGQPIEQLEQAFQTIERAHVYVSGYFQRAQTDTRIPQFLPDSYFMTHYTEEIYAVSSRQETLETLESHYNSLCSEAAEANKD